MKMSIKWAPNTELTHLLTLWAAVLTDARMAGCKQAVMAFLSSGQHHSIHCPPCNGLESASRPWSLLFLFSSSWYHMALTARPHMLAWKPLDLCQFAEKYVLSWSNLNRVPPKSLISQNHDRSLSVSCTHMLIPSYEILLSSSWSPGVCTFSELREFVPELWDRMNDWLV